MHPIHPCHSIVGILPHMWKCSESAYLAGNSKFAWLTGDSQGKHRKVRRT